MKGFILTENFSEDCVPTDSGIDFVFVSEFSKLYPHLKSNENEDCFVIDNLHDAATSVQKITPLKEEFSKVKFIFSIVRERQNFQKTT